MALKTKKFPHILDAKEHTTLKWLLLIEPFLLRGFPVQTDALKPHSATFLLSNYLACFHSPVLFQVHTASFPPPEAATAQLNPLQQEAVHRHCLDIAAGRGTQRTTLDKHTSALENPQALQGKTFNY